MSHPLISILMPAYQADKYIFDSIESCREQSYTNWELCIVDDGSQDSTLSIALDASARDKRIKVTSQDHSGCPIARNRCLQISSGEIIARQDADDLQDPLRLEKQVNYLLLHKGVDIVTCKMRCFTEGSKKDVPSLDDTFINDFNEGMNEHNYLLNKGGRPVCASIVAWKHVYQNVGLFNPKLDAGSDGEWNFRAIIHGIKWGFIAEPLYTYRKHQEQISVRLAHQQSSNHEASRVFFHDVWNTE